MSEMYSICCDAEVSGGRPGEPFVYRCMACDGYLSLRLHRSGTPQVYFKEE